MPPALPWVLLSTIAAAVAGAKPDRVSVPQAGPTPSLTEPETYTTSPIRVRMETSYGDLVLELDAERAPISVANFLRYVDEGFYERTSFHRVIPGFLIQGGGYTQSLVRKTEGLHDPIRTEWGNGLKNRRMTLAAARVPGKPNSATSQFFINATDNPQLDEPQEDGAGYAVFGRVIEGEEVVEKIGRAKVQMNERYREPGGTAVTPARAIVIRAVYRLDDDGTSDPGRLAGASTAPREETDGAPPPDRAPE